MIEDDPGFGVYVHWPYCRAICPYCDFNVYRDRDADPAPLVEAIVTDLADWRARTGPERVASLYLGGGTPSRLPPASVERIIDAVEGLWGFEAKPEITIEANPEDADPTVWSAFAAAGVERLSLGAQSFDDEALRALGRWHDAASVERAIEVAGRAFPRTSLDLIYARTDQTLEAWEAELGRALATGMDHLSLYQLTIEDGTAFARQADRGDLPRPDPDRGADFYELTQAVCDAAGAAAYEVSNHARSLEARSRHNLIYWRSGRWAGVGPGAHGRLHPAGSAMREARVAHRRPQDYIRAVEATGSGAADVEPLDRIAQARETLAMGLRLAEGLSIRRYEAIAGEPLDRAAADALSRGGWLILGETRLTPTASGRLLADRLAAELAP